MLVLVQANHLGDQMCSHTGYSGKASLGVQDLLLMNLTWDTALPIGTDSGTTNQKGCIL